MDIALLPGYHYKAMINQIASKIMEFDEIGIIVSKQVKQDLLWNKRRRKTGYTGILKPRDEWKKIFQR
jgi:hypothetical protein